MKYRTALLLAIVMLPLGSLLAADGAIPIWESATITEPGRYIVTRNIEPPGTGFAISIEADDVDLDLSGFKIEGIDTIYAVGNRIKIHNGFVINGNEATVEVTGHDFVIRDLTLQSTDDGDLFVNGNNGVIENVVVAPGSANPSISVSGHGNTIRSNVVRGKSDGISVWGDGNRIRQNTASDCGVGIAVNGSFDVIEGNFTTGNSGFGVGLGGTENVYRGNTSRGNGVDFQDNGTNNTSHGDNYMPGQM